MKISQIDFPQPLLDALKQDNLVVFAGAGVSMGKPACLPSFNGLASAIAHGTGMSQESTEPQDRFLGRLHRHRVAVHRKAIDILETAKPEPTDLHVDLLRLFPSVEKVRIVSTNFDLLFQVAAQTVFGQTIETYVAPALPLGNRFRGIVQVHGSQIKPEEIVLTDSDFGKAYLFEGWATKFLTALFQKFAVVFVGYSHQDPIVNYLARALPETQIGLRYALVPGDEDPKHWEFLGIEPVRFPRPIKTDYGGLYDGIRGLAAFAKLSILDWQRELQAIASNKPPSDPEVGDKLLWALKEVSTTRFFLKSCSDSDWVVWLNERGAFDGLFKQEELSEAEAMLGNWLAFQFSRRDPETLFLLFARHGMQVNPRFWKLLVGEVGAKRTDPPVPKILLKWVTLLEAMVPPSEGPDTLWQLGERCVDLKLVQGVFRIVNAMLEGRISLESRSSARVGSTPPKSRLLAGLAGGHHHLEGLWEKGIKPNLHEVCGSVLEMAAGRLQDQYNILEIWEEVDPNWDATSYRRHAIEPHDQDRYHNSATDTLIDITRDCLEWMSGHEAGTAAEWCNKHIKSTAPLLRRLAVHALYCREDLDADAKIHWLLANLDIFDTVLHHETYRAMAQAYAAASSPARKKVVDKILAFRWSESETEEDAKKSAWVRFGWLSWLSQANPSCPMLKPEMEAIESLHPKVAPGRFPDFSHWTESIVHTPTSSPWSAEELLDKPPKDWVDQLLSFSDERSFPDSGREVLLRTVSAAAMKSPTWGLDLAAELENQGKWTSDIWPVLIDSWGKDGLEADGRTKSAVWMGHAELHKQFPHEIAQTLLGWSTSSSSRLLVSEIPSMHAIAAKLLASLDRSMPTKEGQDWTRKAHSHSAGILARFHLHTLEIWRCGQNPVPIVLSSDFENIFQAILGDASFVGKMGRAILAGSLNFLLAVDESWTRNNLLPLFTWGPLNPEFQVMWDGFLWDVGFTPRIVKEIGPLVLGAVSRLNDELLQVRERFVELYTVFTTFYAEDPIGVWIPALYKAGGTNALESLNRHINHHLMTESKSDLGAPWPRWLRQYWKNRIDGVPELLSDKEAESILDWLPHLGTLFPEGVELAMRMPPLTSHHTLLVHELRDLHLVEKFPTEAARLIIHLGKGQDGAFGWYGAKEILASLLSSSIDDLLKTELRELAAKTGENL